MSLIERVRTGISRNFEEEKPNVGKVNHLELCKGQECSSACIFRECFEQGKNYFCRLPNFYRVGDIRKTEIIQMRYKHLNLDRYKKLENK
jgi:hypothetical protein